MKRNQKRLNLSADTVRTLTASALGAVNGGSYSQWCGTSATCPIPDPTVSCACGGGGSLNCTGAPCGSLTETSL